jgi:L-arabinose 1-dehydrogenase
MRLGMIGLGAIAPFFLRVIERRPDLTLAAVCDLNQDKLKPFAARGVPGFTSHADLLDAGLAEAVVVTLPNHAHTPVVVDALERGVHVCCEKPLTITAADAEALVATARRGAATLFTAFHRRYNLRLLELIARLPADRRRIARVTARYHENILEHTGGDRWYLDPKRCGGGCVIDNGPNALDAVRLLLGQLTLVDATIGDLRAGVEFCAVLELTSRDGIPVTVELDWALPTGEAKDVTVELRDGRRLTADLLAGFDGFKASLTHEYEGVLADFQRAVAAGAAYRDSGREVIALVERAYAVARRKEVRLRMRTKHEAVARVVKLLFHTRDDRGMTLSPWTSRCVPAGQIHELVTTIDRPQRPGDRVDRVGFLGFAEFRTPAVVERGDEVWVGSRRLGVVAGFDECHHPNHYNLLIGSERVWSAADLDLRVGDAIRFVEGPR